MNCDDSLTGTPPVPNGDTPRPHENYITTSLMRVGTGGDGVQACSYIHAHTRARARMKVPVLGGQPVDNSDSRRWRLNLLGTPPVPAPRPTPVPGDTPPSPRQQGREGQPPTLPNAQALTRPPHPHEGPRTILGHPRRPYPPAFSSPRSALALR